MPGLTRREWLSAVSVATFGAATRRASAQDAAGRIAAIVAEYAAQGFHRTGTRVDQSSAQWLAEQVRRSGPAATLESFSINRVDLLKSQLELAGRRVDGVPLFDGAFTTAAGVSGRLGPLNSDADIGFADIAVNAAGTGALGAARRANRHKAIVVITRGLRPGLCPSNADSFLEPFGPPVLQLSSDDESWVADHAARGGKATLIANVLRNGAIAENVTAEMAGTDSSLPPIIVMTPRSGWYWCASERGGGIACWLEIMRGLRELRLKRTVLFVASSGHELGHLGINAYIDKRPGIVKRAAAWLHLGANIGAATMANNNLLQASDNEIDRALSDAMQSAGLTIARRAPRANVPAGEAEAIHRGGGRYVSSIGGNALFHNIADKGSEAVDPHTVVRFSASYLELIRKLDAG